MQDAFLRLYERWDRMDEIDDPKAYLYRTAFNVWNKRSRRAARALRWPLAQPARGTTWTPPMRGPWSRTPSPSSAHDSGRRSS